MRARVVAVVTLVLALAGCAPSGGSGESASPSGTPSASALEPARACTRDDLTVSYLEADATAGHRQAILTFENTGDAACGIEGYPIVFLGSSEGAAPTGPQAEEDTIAPVMASTLQPGDLANTVLTITRAGIVEGCTVATTTHLIVAPPLDHVFVGEDDGSDLPTPEIDGCLEDDIGLLAVRPLLPTS